MALPAAQASDGRVIGRYVLYDSIASGGMAKVHLGRLVSRFGFSRTVAIKRLHEQFAAEPEFVAMLVDEARLASRINHPNVVQTLDVVFEENEVLLVMEYVEGESLATLLRLSSQGHAPISVPIAIGVVTGALRGLHAAHIATAEDGSCLEIVHRDMSPQNIMVGVNGVAKVLDFGVAKAALRNQITVQGQVKGKFAYMAPEQLRGEEVDARTDVFAMGTVLWECLTKKRLFLGDDVGQTSAKLLNRPIPPPSQFVPELTPLLDRVVLRALARDPKARYGTAAEFADALEATAIVPRPTEIGTWVSTVAREALARQKALLARIEAGGPSAAVASRPPLLRPVSSDPNDATLVEVPKRPRSRRALVIGVAGALLLGTAVMLLLFGRGAAQPGHGAAQPSAQPRATTPEANPPLPPAASGTTPLAAGSAPVRLSTVPPPSLSDPQAASSSRRIPSIRPRPPSRPSCNPPYWIDESGIRRIRPECL